MSLPRETRQDLRPVSSELNRGSKFFEPLENRRLLSATGDVLMQPALSLTQPSLSPSAVSGAVKGYTPAQISKAYGFGDNLTLDNGLGSTVKGDGSGQTIAIVDAYNDPNIAKDLQTFDKQFTLDDPSLSVVSQTGSITSLPKTDSGWAQEISLDVEWAHAVAPKANIMLVEAKSASLSDLLSAVDYARSAAGVSVVSMSWGTDEFFSEHNYDSHFTTPSGHQGVTFVASAGDDGSWYGASWPSVSSNVLSVGGTTLSLDSSGNVLSETGWSGSGGGVSRYETEPTYQSQYGNIGGRGAPDVSINANPYTGYAVYDSLAYQGSSGWQVIGGTSAGAPQWAALVAIANQGRVLRGAGTLDGVTGTLPAIYSLYNSTNYTNSFNDVTMGRSSWFVGAHSGWDAVTGLGSPKGDPIVDALAGFGLKSSTPTTPATTTVTTTVAKKTATRQAESASVSQVAVALPAPQQAGSIFSSVKLSPAIELVANANAIVQTSTAGAVGNGYGSSGSEVSGLSGSNAFGGVRIQSATLHQAEAQAPSRVGRIVFDQQSNPLRHLLDQPSQETVLPAKPGRIFSASTYDAATFAASGDDSGDLITFKQLAALAGAGVLIGSYAMEMHRRKRALISMGIESE